MKNKMIPDSERENNPEILINDAIDLMNKNETGLALKKITNAIKYFSRCVEIDPVNADSYIARGIIFKAIGEIILAIQDFLNALLINSDPKNNNLINEYIESCYGKIKSMDIAELKNFNVQHDTPSLAKTVWIKTENKLNDPVPIFIIFNNKSKYTIYSGKAKPCQGKYKVIKNIIVFEEEEKKEHYAVYNGEHIYSNVIYYNFGFSSDLGIKNIMSIAEQLSRHKTDVITKGVK